MALRSLFLVACTRTLPATPAVDDTGTTVGTSDTAAPVVDSGTLASETVFCGDLALTNNDATCVLTTVFPYAGEEGHWAAARLVPPSWPFTVTAVRYSLYGSGYCDNGLAHTLELFVGTGDVPPERPVPLFSVAVPETAAEIGDRVFDVVLPAPIGLQTDEVLWVAVQNSGIAGVRSTCFTACAGPAVDDHTNYWSNADHPPYPWVTLQSFGIAANYTFCADGS